MAEAGVDLVYGGASIGLMGKIADTVLAHGGKALGAMPEALADKEIAHPGLTELHITSSMHDRKALMADLSDGFIAMPGGLGTLEELFESWTWAQLKFHDKPVALFNPPFQGQGFFDPLIAFLDQAVKAGFIKAPHRDMLLVDSNPTELLRRIKQYKPSTTDKLAN